MDGWWVDEWITVSGTNTENQLPGGTSEARVETDRNLVDSFTIFPNPIYHLRYAPFNAANAAVNIKFQNSRFSAGRAESS